MLLPAPLMTSDHTESLPLRSGRREAPTGKGASWETWRVGDEPPVHIEFEATNERDVAPTGHGVPGQGVSGSRVVREPGRWSRLVVVVAVVGSLAGGLFWWVGDRGPEDGLSSGSASDTRPTRVAFHDAVGRLLGNRSFAYEGEVHAVEQSAFRPGDWTARDVTVKGAVLMSHGLTRDVAVDATGRAVETVTSGPTVWTRSASTVDGLGDERWAFRSAPGPATLGTAAIAHLMFSAKAPREAARDATGRHVIRATLPVADPREGYGRMLDDAELLLSLDVDGDIARISVRSAARGDPDLVVELDIMRLGEPQAIAVPEDGDAGLRRTVPVEELDAVGVRPVSSDASRRDGSSRRVGDPAAGGSSRVPASLSVVSRSRRRVDTASSRSGSRRPHVDGSSKGMVSRRRSRPDRSRARSSRPQQV